MRSRWTSSPASRRRSSSSRRTRTSGRASPSIEARAADPQSKSCCRSACTSSVDEGERGHGRATSSRRSRARRRRRRTSPAVCREWPSSSRPASRRSSRSSREIDGMVSFGTDSTRQAARHRHAGSGEPSEYLIPKGKHIAVHEGDRVRAGEALMDGSSNPHDILKIKGEKELAKYLVDEVQEVYRLQGVKINDKHIETIVRQMLRKRAHHGSGRHRLPDRRAGREGRSSEVIAKLDGARARRRRRASRCCSASRRRRSRPSRSSRPLPSRRRRRC